MMIQIQQLCKIYAEKTVIQIEELQINAGETIGVIGNNGAGKTTLFRMILDLIRPDQGQVLLKGKSVAEDQEWKNYTASYLDEGFLIGYLNPEEYFDFIAGLQGMSKRELADSLQQYTEIFNGEILNTGKFIRDFSKGNQNKIGICSALMQRPELLILDEPFANLDPSTQIRLKTHLKSLNASGLTLLISSHDLNHVTDVCDRIILFEKGKIIRDLQKDEHTLKELETYFAL